MPTTPSSSIRFAERGPHCVGLKELTLTDPAQPERLVPVDIWYPAAFEPPPGSETAAHPLNRPHDAYPGAQPQPGPLPLIVFSHGNSGLRRQSTFLTTHLASWGFVVAAPDHTGNTFFEMIRIRDEQERKRAHFEARRNRPNDLALVIEIALGETAAESGTLESAAAQRAAGERSVGPCRDWPQVDAARIAVAGHSYGGWAALKMPRRDPRVRAVCGLAPASEPFVGRKAFEPDELPFEGERPTLIVAAIDDVLVDLETSVRPLFDRLGPPRALVGMRDSDHFHFCDGIELLHGLHENNPRTNQPRPTRPLAQLQSEQRTHRSLRALVTFFFSEALADTGDPLEAASQAALAELDPSLVRLS